QGLLLAGQAHSVLMPEAMTEDALAAQVFIPFDGVQAVYARLQSTLEAPLAAGPASAATALAEAAPALATATVIPPTAVAPAEEMRAEGVLPEVMPAESVEIAPSNSLAEIAEGTLGGLAVGTEQVMESAQVGYATVAQGASAGLDWLAGAVT